MGKNLPKEVLAASSYYGTSRRPCDLIIFIEHLSLSTTVEKFGHTERFLYPPETPVMRGDIITVAFPERKGIEKEIDKFKECIYKGIEEGGSWIIGVLKYASSYIISGYLRIVFPYGKEKPIPSEYDVIEGLEWADVNVFELIKKAL